MKKLTSLGLCALMAPVVTLGIGTAYAQMPSTTPESAQSQQPAAHSAPISNRPANAVLGDELMGSQLKSPQGQDIGSISNLIIDDQGQIVAVIVEVGGLLGIGEKNVAIAWNLLERTRNEARDGYDFRVNLTEVELRDAPEYKLD